MKPQKKGFSLKSHTLKSLRAIAGNFMKFCEYYRIYFQAYNNDVSPPARDYLAGLLMKAPRKNMERMNEYVDGSEYESTQHFISNSPWDYLGLNAQIRSDVNSILGGQESVLCIDESCFSKKGKCSVGVKRQWNGRLGKVDNCQVGVYASLCNGNRSGLLDYRLYLPEEWADDPFRCNKARIPEEYQVFKTKLVLAQEMIDDAMNNGVHFGWIAMDAFYGRDSKLLYHLDNQSLRFVADVPLDTNVYLDDPKPYMPRRRAKKGPKYKRLQSRETPISVKAIADEHDISEWQTIKIRDTTKGKLSLKAIRKRVYFWDGEERYGREWWLVVTYDAQTKERKYFLSNASNSSLSILVRRHASRFWIERTFQDGKTSVGMADYQVRVWLGWHHHMTMVMLAILFMLQERIRNGRKVELLSCQDIVDLLNYYLPRKDLTEENVFKNMAERHRRRQKSIENAYLKQKRREAPIPK